MRASKDNQTSLCSLSKTRYWVAQIRRIRSFTYERWLWLPFFVFLSYFPDPTQRHEGGKYLNHEEGGVEACRLRPGPPVLLGPGQQVHEQGCDALVPPAWAAVGRQELRTTGRLLGRRLHHGGDVDAQSHNAGPFCNVWCQFFLCGV